MRIVWSTVRVRIVQVGALVMTVGLAFAIPAWAATKSVSLQNIMYNPKSVSIHVNDKVVWTNNDGTTHTVTASSGQSDSFDSGLLAPSATFSKTFKKAGTFKYYCQVHCSNDGCAANGMRGQVVVTAAASATPTPTVVPSATASAAPATQTPATRTAPPRAFAPVPLTATPLSLPSLTPPPGASPGTTLRPFGTPQAAARTPGSKSRAPIAGLAIAAVMVSTGAAVATYLRFGRPSSFVTSRSGKPSRCCSRRGRRCLL